MNNKVKNILRFSVIAFGLSVVLLSLFLARETVPFKITSLLREGHPLRIEYEKYEKNYGDEKFVWFCLEKDTAFSESEMFELGSLVRRFYGGIRGVKTVEGIENAEYISFKTDYFQLKPFIVDKKLTPGGEKALKDQFWSKTLLSDDGKALLFNITLTDEVTGLWEKEVLKEIVESRNQWEENYPGLRAHFIGTKVGKYYFLKEMIKNQMTVTPLLFLFLGFLIWFLFRNWRVVFWFFFVMFLSYSFVLLAIILIEGGLNPYSGFALFFVLIVATSDLIHFFSVYLTLKEGLIEERINRTIKQIFWPCFLTTLTTAVSFMSLVMNEMAPVFYFGIYCTIGSLICFLLTFYFLPLVLRLFNINFVLRREIPKFKLDKLIDYVQINPKRILLTTLVFVGVFSYFSTKLKIDDDFYGKFKEEHELSKSISTFSKNFNFIGSVDILISSKKGSILDDSFDGTLGRLEKDLNNFEGVSYSRSFQGIMDYIERAIKNGTAKDESKERMRQRKESIFHLLNDYKVFDLSYIENLNQVKFTLFMSTSSSNDLERLLLKISALSNRSEYKDLSIKTMGFSSIRTYLMNHVIDNFIKSFAFSLTIVFIIFILIFKKIGWAILAMIPNLLPLVFISGTMGFLDFRVESNLVLMICVSLGIAVDDTIHFLYAMKRALKKGAKVHESINIAFKETSNALLGTTLVFVLSFPTFFLADLKLFQQMGLFIMAALLVALLADFIVLPALFSLFRRSS